MSRLLFCGLGAVAGFGGVLTTALCKDNVAFDPKEWRPFKLTGVTKITHNTAAFRFALPTPDSVTGLETASCITVRYPGEDGKDVVRPYQLKYLLVNSTKFTHQPL